MGLPDEGNYHFHRRATDWDAVRERIISHPHEASLRDVNRGDLPLKIALENKSMPIPESVLKSLLAAYPHALDDWVFNYACSMPHTTVEVIAVLLDTDPSLVFRTDIHRSLPIHTAAGFGNVEIARFLIKKYPDCLSVRDDANRLPLHNACRWGSTLSVKLFLEEGIRYNVGGPNGAGGLFLKDIIGKTPLDRGVDRLKKLESDSVALQNLTLCSAVAARVQNDNMESKEELPPSLFIIQALIDFVIQVDRMFPHRYRETWRELFRTLLSTDLDRKVAKVLDSSGSLLFHYAAAKGLTLAKGLGEILEAYPLALYTRGNPDIEKLPNVIYVLRNSRGLEKVYDVLLNVPYLLDSGAKSILVDSLIA